MVREHSAPRSAKSAERIEGAMIAAGAIFVCGFENLTFEDLLLCLLMAKKWDGMKHKISCQTSSLGFCWWGRGSSGVAGQVIN